VLSVLVGDDFERDRLSYRDGFAKPALVWSNNHIEWSAVADPNRRGTHSNPSRLNRFIAYMYERSMVIARIMPRIDFSGHRLKEKHTNATEKDGIIEWTLKEFSNLKVKKKILLLKYDKKFSDSKVLNERETILEIANALSLKVVDTMDVIKKYEPQK